MYSISKNSGRYKQCLGEKNRADCGCTLAQRSSLFASDSDCIEVVTAVPWRQMFIPQFVLSINDDFGEQISTPFELQYTIEEVNGRTDYCFNTTAVDCSSKQQVSSFLLTGSNYVGIKFSGAELFHFHVTVQTPSYCDLQTEFIVWAHNPPLPQSIVWVVMSSTATAIALILLAGFLAYSYLYNNDQ